MSRDRLHARAVSQSIMECRCPLYSVLDTIGCLQYAAHPALQYAAHPGAHAYCRLITNLTARSSTWPTYFSAEATLLVQRVFSCSPPPETSGPTPPAGAIRLDSQGYSALSDYLLTCSLSLRSLLPYLPFSPRQPFSQFTRNGDGVAGLSSVPSDGDLQEGWRSMKDDEGTSGRHVSTPAPPTPAPPRTSHGSRACATLPLADYHNDETDESRWEPPLRVTAGKQSKVNLFR